MVFWFVGKYELEPNEYFNIEEYRIISGTYNNKLTQSNPSSKWVSSYSVNDNALIPLILMVWHINGYLVSPKLGNAVIREMLRMEGRFRHLQIIQIIQL